MLQKLLTFGLAALFSLACGDDGSSSNNLTAGSGAVASAGSGGGLTTAGVSGAPGAGGVAGLTPAEGNTGGTPLVGAAGTGTGAGGAEATGPMEWLPSWATTIQSTEVGNLPPRPLPNNTLRQFVWPTVSGQEIRIQLSNEKGTTPVDIQKVHIAMALTEANPANSAGQVDPATDATFTFSGTESVTIGAGATVWSDPLTFPLQEIKLTAVTMQFGAQVPTLITGHPGSRTTTYVADGDVVAQQSMGMGAATIPRWYFINAIEVMAPAEAAAIAVLGDSITDGFGVIDRFTRWTDFLTLAIQNDAQIADTRSVLNFGMGANNLTVSGEFQDSGVVRFSRDVLTRDKIKWLIVLEGINDILYSNVPAQPIIDAYSQIITAAHEKGILVYGATITPTSQGNLAIQGDPGIRGDVNTWIRTSGEFDQVIDFAAVIGDPTNANALLQVYNSNDGLHPNDAGYEAMANAVDLPLFYTPSSN